MQCSCNLQNIKTGDSLLNNLLAFLQVCLVTLHIIPLMSGYFKHTTQLIFAGACLAYIYCKHETRNSLHNQKSLLEYGAI